MMTSAIKAPHESNAIKSSCVIHSLGPSFPGPEATPIKASKGTANNK